MFFKELKRSLFSMFKQKEFYFAFLVSTAILLLSLLASLKTFFKADLMYIRPAWSYWGAQGTWFEWDDRMGSVQISAQTIQVYVMLLLPFLASLAYSYVHFDNCKNGICKTLIPRMGRASYYRANALTVFFSGLFIAAVPLFLQQIVLLVAMPATSQQNLGSTMFTDNYASHLLGLSGSLSGFQIAHPYLFNLITAACISITAGITALCSYTFSLYFHKNRFVAVLLIPFLAFIVVPAIVKCIGGYSHASYMKISYALIGVERNYYFMSWLYEIIGIFAINIAFIEWKIRKGKDILI